MVVNLTSQNLKNREVFHDVGMCHLYDGLYVGNFGFCWLVDSGES